MDESTQPAPSTPDDRVRERTFVRRGQQVVLREILDLVAVRDPAGLNDRGLESAIPASLADLLPPSRVEPFERAGWRLLPPSSKNLPADATTSELFLGRGDRLLLGTNNLAIQLKNDAPPDEVNTLLVPFASRVVERLPFGRGLYRIAVDPADPRDAIDIANELMASDLVEFAEPEHLEATGSR